MIAGLGIDLVELARIEKAVKRHGSAFAEKILTSAELDLMKNAPSGTEFLAGRWAAKEAVSKALGTGLGGSCGLLEIEIGNGESGAPEARLSGAALATMRRRGIVSISVSITHERSMAAAAAVAEK